MKHYKILENRPELSTRELTESMDFEKIKANSAITKTLALKALITKTILGCAIIGSVIIISTLAYKKPVQDFHTPIVKQDINSPFITKEVFAEKTTTLSPKPGNKEIENSIKSKKTNTGTDTIKIKAVGTSSISTILITSTSATVSNEAVPSQPVSEIMPEKAIAPCFSINYQKPQKNTNVKLCKIWHGNDFCAISNIPQNTYHIDCNNCNYDYINCKTLNTNDITCIVLTLTGNGKQSLKLDDKLKNIALVGTDKKIYTPKMIGIGNDSNFFGDKFNAKKFIVYYSKDLNIYLFFKNAKAGDRIIINNFIEAQIEE